MKWSEYLRNIVASGLDGLRRNTEYAGDSPLFGATPIGGVPVDKDSALQLTAFWGCVRYISSAVALLPWGVYQALPNGGREEQRKHAKWEWLKEAPYPGMTSFAWREAMVWNALVTGNALSEITTDGLKIITEPVQFLKPEVGGIAYQFMDGRVLLSSEVFHLRGPSRDGRIGLSVISAANEPIGLGLASQSYGSSFYGAGTHVGGVYEAPGQLTKEQIDALRQQIDEDKGARRAHRPRILTAGMKYVADTIPPQDAQYLETRKYSDLEMCQIFGVPPQKIAIEGGATAYASREQGALEAVIDCLMPWTVRAEQEANLKLFTRKERTNGFYSHMNLDVHLRGDAKSRGEFYQVMIRNGAMTPNTALAKEDMAGVEGGDELLISRDLIPLSKIGDYADSQIKKNAEGGKEPQPNAFAPLIADALDCIRTRAKQDRSRGRPPDATKEFARLKLEPIRAAHEIAGCFFDAEKLIEEALDEPGD